MTYRPGFHRCPAPECQLQVPNRMFACRGHWFQLTKPVQDAIYATASKGLLHPERRAAISSAMEEWHA